MRAALTRLLCGFLIPATVWVAGCAIPVRIANGGNLPAAGEMKPRLSPVEIRSFFQRAASQNWSVRVNTCLPTNQLWHVSEVAEQGVVLRQQSESATAVCDLRYIDVLAVNDFPPGTPARPKLVRAMSWTD
jgi:hypothetical protein